MTGINDFVLNVRTLFYTFDCECNNMSEYCLETTVCRLLRKETTFCCVRCEAVTEKFGFCFFETQRGCRFTLLGLFLVHQGVYEMCPFYGDSECETFLAMCRLMKASVTESWC
jgi:hypothetical protein